MTSKTIKLSISNFRWYPAVCRVNDVLAQSGFELRIVGGAVRDIILMKSPKDIDLCTTATPDEMVKVFTEHNFTHHDTGIQHGTLTVYKKMTAFEITSLRNDVISEEGEKEVVYCTSFEQDAARRDLTINALSMDLAGEVFDYYDGIKDILSQKIKFVESPRQRISEDPLRILRYFRMHCTLDWPVYKHGNPYRVIEELAPRLKNVSGERIWKELQKILVSRQAVKVLDIFMRCNIMDYIGIPSFLISTPLQSYLRCDEIRLFKVRKSVKSAVLLGLMVNCKQSLSVMFKGWKASNRCLEVALFAHEHRDKEITMQYLRRYLYDFESLKIEQEKEMLVTFLCSRKPETVTDLNIRDVYTFKSPEFPFSSDDFSKVPEFKTKRKDAIKVLKQAWIDSDFKLSKSQMIEKLSQMVKDQE